MGMPQLITEGLSFNEYLAQEKESEQKHEFIDGLIYAMAGASRNHNLISQNFSGLLFNHLRGKPCATFVADMLLRLTINEVDIGYYPDLMVVCDTEDNNNYYVKNPTVIIEVLSKSTQRIDMREKFLAYKTIKNIQEYILIKQGIVSIMLHQRKKNWQVEHIGEDEMLIIPSIKLTLAAKDIYERVVFDE